MLSAVDEPLPLKLEFIEPRLRARERGIELLSVCLSLGRDGQYDKGLPIDPPIDGPPDATAATRPKLAHPLTQFSLDGALVRKPQSRALGDQLVAGMLDRHPIGSHLDPFAFRDSLGMPRAGSKGARLLARATERHEDGVPLSASSAWSQGQVSPDARSLPGPSPVTSVVGTLAARSPEVARRRRSSPRAVSPRSALGRRRRSNP